MSDKFYTKGIYSDGMVLQRNTLNCIFGCGEKGESVEMKFREQIFTTTVGENKEWSIEFNSGDAGGPYEIILSSGNEKILFCDVYIGEVWVSSGQSNAQLQMTRLQYSYEEEFALPANPYIRMITIPISYNFDGEQDSVENPTWKCASPETLAELSGTAYFFAKKMSEELKVPVGIINASQGGSPISAWMSKAALKRLDCAQKCIEELEKWEEPSAVAAKKEDMQKNQSAWDSELAKADKGLSESWEKLSFDEIKDKWDETEIPGIVDVLKSAGIVWFKKEVELTEEQAKLFNAAPANLWLGTIIDADIAYVNGVQVGVTYYSYPPRRYKVPAGLLKAGKNTITIRVQKNSKMGGIRFYTEKPCCLFTSNVKVATCVYRNVEIPENKIPEIPVEKAVPADGVYINLAGKWKIAVGAKVRDCPSGMFFEWVPTALYNAMLSPAFKYAVAGALWYQGESDAYQPENYQILLQNLILLWREKFVYAPENMPFVIMQLPNWSDGIGEDYVSQNIGWAKMRDVQQLISERVSATGLAVTIDAGEWNDLHPEKKKTGGTRAALEALRVAYLKPYNMAPKAAGIEHKKGAVVVQFATGSAKLISKTDEVPGFVFVEKNTDASADKSVAGKLIEVKGKLISEREVEIQLPETAEKLEELRYLWSDSPNPISLYSSDGLPAAPFRIKF